MNYNYHTHTKRCGHAEGLDEEYVIRAIENGIKYMGFSDHIPLRLPNGHESDFRVPVDSALEYVKSINSLADKYKDEIELTVGFETEFVPQYFDQMVKGAIEYGAKYLILGQHFIYPYTENQVHSIRPNDNACDLEEYVSSVITAIKSGVISYVAHPDMFNFTGDEKIYREQTARLCKEAIANDVPLELNLLGIRQGRIYPNDRFWAIAGEMKVPMTLGFDAHTPKDAYDEKSLKTAKELIKKHSLNYIGKPTLKPLTLK